MQDTLAYIHKLVFAGINGPIIDANSEQRRHDYDDKYAAIMEEFDRINLDNDDADLPQPPSAPRVHHLLLQITTNPSSL